MATKINIINNEQVTDDAFEILGDGQIMLFSFIRLLFLFNNTTCIRDGARAIKRARESQLCYRDGHCLYHAFVRGVRGHVPRENF